MTSRSCTDLGAASPDGRLLYSSGADEKVRVWEKVLMRKGWDGL